MDIFKYVRCGMYDVQSTKYEVRSEMKQGDGENSVVDLDFGIWTLEFVFWDFNMKYSI
jgi:hypothetical protein